MNLLSYDDKFLHNTLWINIMKYLLALLLCLPLVVQADQRFETWQGLCHFAYDSADDDNEVYFANCSNSINTYDAQDGQGRLAYGTSKITESYHLPDLTRPAFQQGNLKGADADPAIYGDDYVTAAATPCVMVTSNYNAAADDNNETVYVTDNWNLEISNIGPIDSSLIMWVTFTLNCRNGIAQ